MLFSAVGPYCQFVEHQPELFADFHETPLANKSIESILDPPLEILPGYKRWEVETVSLIIKNLPSDYFL